MSYKIKKVTTGLLVFALLTGCSAMPKEEAVVTPTTRPSASVSPTKVDVLETEDKPSRSQSPSSTNSADTKPPSSATKSAKPNVAVVKSPTPQVTQTKKSKSPDPKSTPQKLPERFEIGKPYPWENDFNPLRFGLAYTDLKPVEWLDFYAVYLPAPDQVLLVYGWGPWRQGYLFKGVIGYKVTDERKAGLRGYVFRAVCGDEPEWREGSGTGHIMGATWNKLEHPTTFTNLPLEEESPCTK